jgi:hypothetical protein
MKNCFIILLAICCFTFTGNAQNYGDTLRYPEIDRFKGTWQWVDGSDTLTICLQKQIAKHPLKNVYMEIAVGWHRYVKGGIMIESTLDSVGDHYYTNTWSLAGIPNSNDELVLPVTKDKTLNKIYEVNLKISPSNTSVVWKSRDRPGIYWQATGYNQFTLPRRVILTKQ